MNDLFLTLRIKILNFIIGNGCIIYIYYFYELN